MEHYDLVIIGTGSGNSLLDERFADWNVAIVEKGIGVNSAYGGTCLNVGCIPTKMFVHTADVAQAPTEGAKLGVGLEQEEVRWAEMRERIFGRIDEISAGGRRYRVEDNPNVTVFEGHGRFTGQKELTVETEAGVTTLTAEKFVIAAGGRPSIPDIDGIDTIDYHTSDTVMRLAELPPRMVIMGTGFIGAEFAHIFSALGVEVTMIGRSGRVLRSEDTAISNRFTDLATNRWDLRLNRKEISVQSDDGIISLHLEGPSGSEVVEAESLLIATGRVPNSDLLDVAASGIATDANGKIVVDETQRTSVPGVWALGDISSPYELKHVANHESRVVQHNVLHPDEPRTTDHRVVPHAVFTAPQIASVGLTEQDAEAAGLRYVIATQDYAGIAYGWAMEDNTGFAKILADPDTGKILGAHIIGPQAPTLLQPLVQAMQFGLDAHSMGHGQYWIHPAMPELIENALLQLG